MRAASQSSSTMTRWRTHQVARDFIGGTPHFDDVVHANRRLGGPTGGRYIGPTACRWSARHSRPSPPSERYRTTSVPVTGHEGLHPRAVVTGARTGEPPIGHDGPMDTAIAWSRSTGPSTSATWAAIRAGTAESPGGGRCSVATPCTSSPPPMSRCSASLGLATVIDLRTARELERTGRGRSDRSRSRYHHLSVIGEGAAGRRTARPWPAPAGTTSPSATSGISTSAAVTGRGARPPRTRAQPTRWSSTAPPARTAPGCWPRWCSTSWGWTLR